MGWGNQRAPADKRTKRLSKERGEMTMSDTGGPEHDFEPIPGLPAQLPKGERIIWQGSPSVSVVMRRLLRSRGVAVYFALAAIWSVALSINNGEALGMLAARLTLIILGAAALFALMTLYARGVAKTSLYTITNKRVVMRIGVALSATFNLPFKQIAGADFREGKNGAGDIALTLKSGHGLSSAVFFPHQRGGLWRKLSPQLICLNDARGVAALLAVQLQAYAALNADQTAADAVALDELYPAGKAGLQPKKAKTGKNTTNEAGFGAGLQPAE
jgi:hypothetical protein